ncbi:N-6 DNA methylase, partial [Staphylococcus aureus]|uniref:N-6 DNA methylase n=1 Tax=Staphylococcus aureus TaxID=1280 RepID=UPI0037D9B307
MLLHHVPYHNFHIPNHHTFQNPPFLPNTFHPLIPNPPYTPKSTPHSKFQNHQPFTPYPKLPPNSKPHFPFIRHIL